MEQLFPGTVSLVVGSIIEGFIKYSASIVKVTSRLHWEPTAVEYLTVVECGGHSVLTSLVSIDVLLIGS